MTVIVKHNKTNTITDWTQAQLDEQIALGNFPSGTTLANIVLPSDWNNDHTLTGLGTMAEQDANTVAITGGTINNTTIGATTATTGAFTTLTVNNTTGTSLANIWSNTNTSPIADLQFTRGTTSTWGGDAFTDYKLRASGGNFIVQSQNNATAVLDLLTFDETNNAVKFSPGGIEQARVSRTASAVNYVQVTGAATGGKPTISAQGSDTNIDLSLTTKGTGAVNLNTGNGLAFRASQTYLTGTSVNYFDVSGRQTGLGPILSVNGSDTDVRMNLTAKGTGSIGFYTNLANTLQMQITPTASAVNYVQVTGAATGSRPVISTQGSDTNIDLALTPKGTGGIVGNVNSGTFTINRDSANNAIKFTAPNGNMYVQTTGGGVILFNTADGSAYQMRVNHTASAVNYVQVTGGATGNSPAVSVAGSDANLDLTLTPKGTGLVRFGTYVAGALLATGYINIKAADGTTYKVLVST
jgi:hypothetical protein